MVAGKLDEVAHARTMLCSRAAARQLQSFCTAFMPELSSSPWGICHSSSVAMYLRKAAAPASATPSSIAQPFGL
jgi:hypothetical protein